MYNYPLVNVLKSITLEQQKFKVQTVCIYSKFIEKNLFLLQALGYINGFTKFKNKKTFFLKIFLKYSVVGFPVIQNIFIYSTPGRKVFKNSYELQALAYTNKASTFVVSIASGLVFVKSGQLVKHGGTLLYKIN